jgi:CBS domain-containing protein
MEEEAVASLTAHDLMTSDVVTVPPDTPVISVARLLAERGISAVPVTDAEGAPLGVVTEADLIRRLAGEEDPRPSWFSGLFGDAAAQAERYARTHGARARDVMSSEPLAVPPDATAAQVASRMEEHNVRRLLVVQQGRLVGIISRADLLRALVEPPAEDAEGLSDARIRRAVMAAMKREAWADSYYTLVDVKDGIVTFHGFCRTAGVQRGLRVLAEQVPGVKGVKDETVPMPSYLFAA